MVESALVVETPEQVAIDFEIAGIGSRLIAALLDFFLMLVLLVGVLIATTAIDASTSDATTRAVENAAGGRSLMNGVDPIAAAVLALGQFLVLFGYYVIAELVTEGRSPGKRAMGLRVVREDGLPIGLGQSLVRNLVRIIDFLPAGYGIGLVTAFLSPRARRLGDLAAGTVVVKDRAGQQLAPPVESARAPVPRVPVSSPLTAAERAVAQRFTDRKLELDDATRRRLARDIAAPIRKRLGDDTGRDDEGFLDAMLNPTAQGVAAP